MSSRIGNRNITSTIFTNNGLAIYYWVNSCISWNIMVTLLGISKKGGTYMTIVVKKVPKCLRGIVKLLFGIKE